MRVSRLFFFRGFFQLLLAFSALVVSCASPPFGIDGPSVGFSVSCDGEPELSFVFENAAGMPVRSFFVEFSLSDCDGVCAFYPLDSASASVECDVPPHSGAIVSVPLSQFLSDFSGAPFSVDFVHVRKIEYDGGNVWRDPFGMGAWEAGF